jgi:hypothetical protein
MDIIVLLTPCGITFKLVMLITSCRRLSTRFSRFQFVTVMPSKTEAAPVPGPRRSTRNAQTSSSQPVVGSSGANTKATGMKRGAQDDEDKVKAAKKVSCSSLRSNLSPMAPSDISDVLY